MKTPGFCTAALLAVPLLAGAANATDTRCVPLHDGVEYRAFLPDGKRFVYVDVKVLSGVFPSVFVIVDKNFDTAGAKLAAGDPLNQWWTDRSKPMVFAGDTVRIRWQEHHTFDFVTDWFSENPPQEFKQAFRGLEKAGANWQGEGSSDTNTFTFQNRVEMSGFRGDYFEVSVPAVTYDGITVTPPVTKFERIDGAITTKC